MAHILVVDDEVGIRTLVTRILERAGHLVTSAADGAEALKIIALEVPDIVLTDLFMPGKEGIETILELRRRFPAIKTIAMSGGGSRGMVGALDLAKGVGAEQILRKPFSRDELLTVIDAAAAPLRSVG